MSRGKYATRADARTAMTQTMSEVEAGRKKIRELVAENKELKRTIAEMKESHAARVRELEAYVDAGTSERYEALKRRLLAYGDRRGRSKIPESRNGMRRYLAESLPMLAEAMNVSNQDVVDLTEPRGEAS